MSTTLKITCTLYGINITITEQHDRSCKEAMIALDAEKVDSLIKRLQKSKETQAVIDSMGLTGKSKVIIEVE